jgi:copper chaperone CopZ
MRQMTMTITGMSCDHCVRAVRHALESLPSVRVDAVDLGSASVTFDPERVSADQLAAAVAAEGYPVTP